MSALSRGKCAVSRRRTSPDKDAQFWCQAGLDKDGLEKRYINKYIGFGVFATRSFLKGEFLLEYCGTRKTDAEIKSDDFKDSTFLFGYAFNNKSWWIDGSESNRLGKFVNDSEDWTSMCNAKMKMKVFNQYPRLCLFATRDIQSGEELRYDYGDDPEKLFWRHQALDKQISVEEESEDDDPFDLAADNDDEEEEKEEDQYDKPSAPEGPLEISDITQDSASLSWKPPKSDGGSPLIMYIIESRKRKTDSWLKIAEVAPSWNFMTFNVTKLDPNNECFFQVSAVNTGPPLTSERPAKPGKEPKKPSIPGSPLQASNISKDKVTLSWKPSSNEGGSPITSYIIESRDGIQGIYVPAGKTDRQTHSLTVDKLKNGKDYYFRVCAENALGRSDYLQMEKAIAPMSEFGKPSIPGSPLQASNISKDKVTLSWKPSSNEGGSPITSYIIESRDGIQGIYVPAGKTDRQTHSLTVDKLKNGKDYYFRVCAENALGRSDYLQMEKAIAPMSEFDKPSAAEGPLEVTEVTDKSAQLSWKPPKLNGGEPLTGYIIERREDKCQYWTKLEKISSDTTTFKVKNMSEENNYFFRVLAENEEGTSPALETREPVKPVKISEKPSIPGSPLEASNISKDKVTLSWKPSSNEGGSPITSYIIESRDGIQGIYVPAGKTDRQTHSLTVDKLQNGKDYYFRVCAENALGRSDYLQMEKAIAPISEFDKILPEKRKMYTKPKRRKRQKKGFDEDDEDHDPNYMYIPDENDEDDEDHEPNYQPDESFEDDDDRDPNYVPDGIDEEEDDNDDDDSVKDSGEEDRCNDTNRVSDSNDSDDGNSVVYPAMNLKTLHFQEITNEKGKTTNKLHACLFCEKQLPNIARHYETVHSNEISVAQILIHPKKSKQRRHMWEELVNKGDYAHNYEVAEKGHGLLIPKRRVKGNNYNDLIPCMCCKALNKGKELWNHSKYCVAKGENKIKNPVKNGRLLLPIPKCDTDFQMNVINNMNPDKIKIIIQNDKRILRYGKRLYDKHGKEPHKIHYISQKLRELGRLMAEVKTLSNDIKGVDDLLVGKNWDTLIEAVKRVAGYNNQTGQYSIPSLALKIGHSLEKCAKHLRSEGNKEDNEEKIKIGDRFLKTYESDWNDSISHHALETLGNRKYNKPLLLPLVEDVVKLNSHLRKEITDTTNSIKDKFDTTKYSRLSQMCLALIILFNRRRSGETERMTVTSFQDAMQKDKAPDDVVVCSLTPFEQKLCKTHTRVEIKGKRGRKVALLLTEEMKASLCCLIAKREEAKVTKDLVFGKPGETKFPYRGSDCLKKFSLEANVKNPHALTSTKLRKQLATLTQILNLSETSQDILATFQGHDIRIHREYYRLPEDTLEIAKVSKVLHSINNGDLAKYKGKDFDEIQIADQEAVDSESESESDNDESDCSDVTEEKEFEQTSASGLKKTSKTSASVGPKRHVWSSQEKEAIERQLKDYIRQGKTPGQLPCLNAIRKEPILAKYTWDKIKHATRNLIVSRARKMSKH